MLFFFFNDTATTEIYTLSLHDALPISTDLLRRRRRLPWLRPLCSRQESRPRCLFHACGDGQRSEEHTSELQSQSNLVCRLLLEKKKTNTPYADFVRMLVTIGSTYTATV